MVFRVSYYGDHFAGSQMQTGLRTVEGEFIAACVRLGLFEDWRLAHFAASGRTDRGVHARGQVFSFLTWAPERAITALNYQLPPDCWCTAYTVGRPGFHPRYDAMFRTYRYFFREESLDFQRMDAAVSLFPGVHDFSGFARVENKNPERRVISASIGKENGVFYLEITAESFLWHMVRCIASVLRDTGRGTMEIKDIADRLEGHYSTGIHPAPPDGLVLWYVGYDFSFTPLGQDDRRSVKVRDREGYHRVMATICHFFSDREGH